MGFNRWTYLGPYAELTLPLKNYKRDMCRFQKECPDPTTGYCSKCGMEAKKRFHTFQETDPSLPSLLADVLDEALFTADGMSGPEQPDANTVIYRLVPNVTRQGQPREFHLSEHDAVWMDLSQIETEAEIGWLMQAFGPEWQALQEVYGDVHFKWGFLQWFH